MSPQREDTTIRRGQEPHMEEEDNLWTLESPMITSKTGSLNASIATSMDTWQRNADWKGKNRKQEHVSNAKRKGTLPKTAKESRR